MITFYADSVNEAYQKLETIEWKNEIKEYLQRNSDCIDRNNVLEHFELDAYDVWIGTDELIQQKSRLAKRFKSVILNEYDNLFTKPDIDSNDKECIDNKDIYYVILHPDKFIREFRKINHISQTELSIYLGINQTAISQWERGTTLPSLDNIRKLLYEFNPTIKSSVMSSLKENCFSDNLRNLREDKGMTQEELAKRIGISTITIRSYEANRREPSGVILCKLAKYFNVDPISLLGTLINEETLRFDINKDNYFSDNLKNIRRNLCLTQRELSEKVDIPLATVISYENSKRIPDFEAMKKLAECLEVDPIVLVGKGKKE